MAEDATLIIIKPDAIRRGLVGAVISRLVDELRLEIIGAKAVRVSQALARAHYRQLRDKPFFAELVDYLQGKLHHTSSVLVLVLRGERAIERVRRATGATHPEQADPTSIRGAWGRMTSAGLMENVVHASSDQREAEREITLWFRPQELLPSQGRMRRAACGLDKRTSR